jgi:hypothetical protein
MVEWVKNTSWSVLRQFHYLAMPSEVLDGAISEDNLCAYYDVAPEGTAIGIALH